MKLLSGQRSSSRGVESRSKRPSEPKRKNERTGESAQTSNKTPDPDATSTSPDLILDLVSHSLGIEDELLSRLAVFPKSDVEGDPDSGSFRDPPLLSKRTRSSVVEPDGGAKSFGDSGATVGGGPADGDV